MAHRTLSPLRALLYALAICSVLAVGAWVTLRFGGRWSRVEVARISSPSKQLEAVLVETNGGATTSFGYEIFLVAPGVSPESGAQVASLYGAVRSDSAYGVNLRWDGSDKLILEYLHARQERQLAQAVRLNGRTVQILLRSGIEDLSAPGGGMEYNLSR